MAPRTNKRGWFVTGTDTGVGKTVVSCGLLHALRARGIGILLIEQFTHLALDVADYCYVLSRGSIRFAGQPDALKADRTILETAYLG